MDSKTRVRVKRSWMARTGQALIAASENEGWWPLLYKWLSRLTLWSVLLYVTGLLLLMAALSHIGERNATTAFLIFLPSTLWLLPAPPLALAALLLHRRALLVLSLAVVWFGYDLMGWRAGKTAPSSGTGILKVMTYNRGQNMNQSLQPFKNATTPDVIVLQESFGRAAGYAAAEGYSEFLHTRSHDEHTILSRYPILEETALPSLPGKPSKAVRYVIDWEGRQIAVYTVHLHSPRDVLASQMRGGFIYGVLGLAGGRWEDRSRALQTFWDGQIADAELVLKTVREDPLPAIVAGDFNSPQAGYVHRLITRELGDSHAEAGEGFGWSFPGTTRNPLSAGGPWIRIDYVFFNQHWEALQCITEPDRPSQHRALTSTLRLKTP